MSKNLVKGLVKLAVAGIAVGAIFLAGKEHEKQCHAKTEADYEAAHRGMKKAVEIATAAGVVLVVGCILDKAKHHCKMAGFTFGYDLCEEFGKDAATKLESKITSNKQLTLLACNYYSILCGQGAAIAREYMIRNCAQYFVEEV